MPRLLALALLASTLCWQPAAAVEELEQLCPMIERFADKLREKHAETPVASFWSGEAALIVFGNRSTQSWTILRANKLGDDCRVYPMGSGAGWFIMLPGEGS